MAIPPPDLHTISESPLTSPGVQEQQQQSTPFTMSPATSNTARFANDPITNQSSAASSRSGRMRAETPAEFDVNAAYVRALRDEQVS